MPLPEFPFTEVKSLERWTNYSGTLPERAIPVFCTPDVIGTIGADAPRRMERHGRALAAIIDHCLEQDDATLRAIGARWSQSNIIAPGRIVIDPGNLNTLLRVNEDWLTQEYSETRADRGFVPIFAQGGVHVSTLNRRLGNSGLALQTSGAGDGHRIAGCIATGTHGSALNIGAVHDTILGIHLIVDRNRSLFIQPETQTACGPELGDWLERRTTLPTRMVVDDELFGAAQVSLGSLGFVHAVVIEAAPLYRLEGHTSEHLFTDGDVWRTLEDLDTSRLHSRPDPYHFELLFHPYPSHNSVGAYARMYWKVGVDGAPFESPPPARPKTSSDTMGLIAGLADMVDTNASTNALRHLIGAQIAEEFERGTSPPEFPGVVFGPTSLPPGQGASTEVVVDLADARDTLETLYGVLGTQAGAGRHLLGPVAVRFVPGTNALLGMNVHEMNCYVELPSVRSEEVLTIYRAFWDALDANDITFTCHWGQMHGMEEASVRRYFGDRFDRWKEARRRILPTAKGRRVFASRLLQDVGLDD